MIKMGLELDDFSFSLSEVPFDITNEETWQEGVIPVAKLFYYLIEDLVISSLISSDEINKLKTKEYTKNLFPSTGYPAVANNREDNRGNSSQKRYRVRPIVFEESAIYISTQFFDTDRGSVINWYKSHKR